MGLTAFRRVALAAGAALVLSALSGAAGAQEWRSISSLIDPDIESKPFDRYDYVNPDAPKGGVYNDISIGTFDSFNPFIVRGTPAGSAAGYLWETLMQHSNNRPGTSHALIAEAFKYPDDYSSATYRLNPNARWHDGKPITVDDVIWSFDMMKQHSPNFARYFANVTAATAISEREVQFTFDQTGNRELPHIMGDLYVLPRHWWEGTDANGKKRDFSAPILEPPLGSGPYRIESFKPGSEVVMTRVEDYWGEDLPVNIGRNNFGRLKNVYFQDDSAAWLAFTKGGFQDLRRENRAHRWANDYNFPAFASGDVVKRTFETTSGEPMQGIVLNTRRSKFQDRRVREALTWAFDFESMNRTLFYGYYTRTDSYFEGGELASSALPQGLELEILESVRDEVPPEVFTQEFKLPVYDTPQAVRQNLRRASELFAEAGWKPQGGKLVNDKGEQFSIEFLGDDPSDERVVSPFIDNLRRLGINATLRIMDASQYVNRARNFDFDVFTAVLSQSQSPGNEQRYYWSSAAADTPGSRNYAGINDPAIDKLIDRVIFAKDREELVAATRALDRVLLWGYYIVPQWHLPEIWVAHWNKFGIPEKQPTYIGVDIDSWWILQDRETAIERKYEDEDAE